MTFPSDPFSVSGVCGGGGEVGGKKGGKIVVLLMLLENWREPPSNIGSDARPARPVTNRRYFGICFREIDWIIIRNQLQRW